MASGRHSRSTVIRLAARASLMSLAVSAASCAGSDDTPVRDGLYLGDHVSFRVAGRRLGEVRLAGVECRLPHPEHPALVLCLLRAPGLPAGEIAIDRAGVFSGALEEVTLTGRFDGELAAGTWTFEGSCGDNGPCRAEGEWTATWREPLVVPDVPDVVPDVPTDVPLDLGPDPGPDVHPDVVVPPTATPEQIRAAEYLATIRAGVGVAGVEQTEGINAAAQAHADYYTRHAEQYAASGLSPHYEDADWSEGFTGVGPNDRLATQGVDGSMGVVEVMAWAGSPEGAIDGWMATLYHRIPLIHPNTERWGFGISTTEVGDLIIGPSAPRPGPARWPLPSADDVSPSWHGGESPQPPLPAGESYPSGPIVTITFPRGSTPRLDRATLVGPAGQAVPAQVQSPANDGHLTDSWAIYSYAPLDGGTAYTVSFEGKANGQPVAESWSFTTF